MFGDSGQAIGLSPGNRPPSTSSWQGAQSIPVPLTGPGIHRPPRAAHLPEIFRPALALLWERQGRSAV